MRRGMMINGVYLKCSGNCEIGGAEAMTRYCSLEGPQHDGWLLLPHSDQWLCPECANDTRCKELDPTGRSAGEPGAKLDAGKPRMELLQDFALALKEVAWVATYGAEKYSEGGWQTVPDGAKRYSGAMLRHYFAEKVEEFDSEDPRFMHAAQVAWNALARLELILREKNK